MNPIEQTFFWPAMALGASIPDTVLGFCQVLFVGALVPTVIGDDKPHVLTAGATAIGASLTAWALAASGLVLGAALTSICAVLWLTIFLQSVYLKLVRR